jgi:hypothetical protein
MTEAITWSLVDPIAEPRKAVAAKAVRSKGDVKTIGFFSNSKQHAAEIEEAMANVLVKRYGIEARYYRKPNASVPGTKELIMNIATECDAVVTGSGD